MTASRVLAACAATLFLTPSAHAVDVVSTTSMTEKTAETLGLSPTTTGEFIVQVAPVVDAALTFTIDPKADVPGFELHLIHVDDSGHETLYSDWCDTDGKSAKCDAAGALSLKTQRASDGTRVTLAIPRSWTQAGVTDVGVTADGLRLGDKGWFWNEPTCVAEASDVTACRELTETSSRGAHPVLDMCKNNLGGVGARAVEQGGSCVIECTCADAGVDPFGDKGTVHPDIAPVPIPK